LSFLAGFEVSVGCGVVGNGRLGRAIRPDGKKSLGRLHVSQIGIPLPGVIQPLRLADEGALNDAVLTGCRKRRGGDGGDLS
jgi:hypothetical protein